MNSAYYVRTQRKKPHTSFHFFDDETGGLRYSAKRKLSYYEIYDKEEKYVGKLNLRLPCNYFVLFSQNNKRIGEIRYEHKYDKCVYHNIEGIDFRNDEKYHNKMPYSVKNKDYWTLKFSKTDYKASKKNCIVQNKTNDDVMELGKRSNGTYRAQFDIKKIDPLYVIALILTRFHI